MSGEVRGQGGRAGQERQDELNRELAQERARMRDIFTLAPAFIATLRGPEHVFEVANPLYRKMIGGRDPVGKTVREALPEVEDQGFVEILDRVYRTGEPFVGNEMPIEVHGPNGEAREYYINFVYYPLRNAQGAIDGIFVHGVDVTTLVAARKEAEGATRQLAFLAEASKILGSSLDYDATLRNLTQLITDNLAQWCTILVADPSGGGVRRVAVSHREVEKRPLVEKLLEDSVPNPQENRALFRSLRSGKPILIRSMDEETMASVTTQPGQLKLLREMNTASVLLAPMVARDRVTGAIFMARDESNEPFSRKEVDLAVELARRAAVAVDNTQLFQQTEQLNRELELRVEERTKELESFSYSVSHDLRAPLRAIDGFSLALHEDYGDELERDAAGYLDRIRGAAKRMGELIDDLLNLSRVARSERVDRVVDLSEVARTVVDTLRKREPDRNVEVEIEPGLEVVGDERLLTVLLENLLGNAWKFTNKNEKARIEVGRTETERGETYFVRDNGAGFDMAFAERLFGAFQRLHDVKEFEGTGVGLATAQRVVHRHNGRIWAHGSVGEGATFYFTLGG